MLLDLDSLDALDYAALREVIAQSRGPYGDDWPDGTRPLEKLVAWATWGLNAQREAAIDLPGGGAAPAPRFDPDSLYHGEWAIVDAVDAERTGPDGDPWPADASTLGRLAAWARVGRSARRGQS